jgi:hypothetical protein
VEERQAPQSRLRRIGVYILGDRLVTF